MSDINQSVMDIFNNFLKSVQNNPIPSDLCGTGEINNINVSNCGWNTITGSGGNTTTDGYYYTYTYTLKTLQDVVNFQLTDMALGLINYIENADSNYPIENIPSSSNFSYLSTITIDGTTSGGSEVYTPEACIPGWSSVKCCSKLWGVCDEWCFSNWDKCLTKVPSTYDSSAMMNFYPFELNGTLENVTGSCNLTYTLDTEKPPNYDSMTEYTISVNASDYTGSTFIYYLYNITASDITTIIGTMDIDLSVTFNVPITEPSKDDIESTLNIAIQSVFNSAFQNVYFKIVINT